VTLEFCNDAGKCRYQVTVLGNLLRSIASIRLRERNRNTGFEPSIENRRKYMTPQCAGISISPLIDL
jgi:hypothetical protein